MPDLRAGLVLALVWLTRLPLGGHLPADPPPLARVVWAFPVTGWILGLISAALYAAALMLGLTPLISALLAIGCQIWLTGGLHEDGLADLADGMGGRTPERRLEIMRDSRIGSYGALTLGLMTALRVAALAALPPMAAVAALIAISGFSRAAMPLAMVLLPPARRDGLGKSAGVPKRGAVLLALGLGFGGCLVASLSGAWQGGSVFLPLALLIAASAAIFQLLRLAKTRLGGLTGDVLGASQQAVEVASYLVLAAFLAQKL